MYLLCLHFWLLLKALIPPNVRINVRLHHLNRMRVFLDILVLIIVKKMFKPQHICCFFRRRSIRISCKFQTNEIQQSIKALKLRLNKKVKIFFGFLLQTVSNQIV